MIFPRLKNESIIQVNDKTRIDASKSFVTGSSSAITKLEIKPDATTDYVDVTTDQYLDWVYTGNTSGAQTLTLLVTAGTTALVTSSLTVSTVASDNLFSSDDELVQYESDILQYVVDGRDSYLNFHRAMRDKILDELASQNILKDDQERFVAADIVDIEDFKKWSMFGVLENIFESLSNQIGDIFDRKRDHYKGLKIDAKKRASLQLDFDGDGEASTSEKADIFSNVLVRR